MTVAQPSAAPCDRAGAGTEEESKMSTIKEFFAVDETIEYYKQQQHKQAAIAIVRDAHLPHDLSKTDEESRLDALEVACAIIALAR